MAYVKGNEPKLQFPVRYLRDTGAILSVLYSGVMPDHHKIRETEGSVTLRGINHVAGTYPVIRTHTVCDLYTGPITVALVNHSETVTRK